MRSLDYSKVDRVYLKPGFTDMRKGIDGLCLIIEQSMQLDPFENSLFLFCGRKSSSIKGILWEEDGFLLLAKRLDEGKFQWPKNNDEVLLLSEQQLRWLLEGLGIEQKCSIPKSRATKIM